MNNRLISERTHENRVTYRVSDEDLFVGSVLHPTDRSEESLSAFYHALAIMAHSGADLTLLHPHGRRSTDSFAGFPGVRHTIAKWRRHDSGDSIEQKLKGSRVAKLQVPTPDPVEASLGHVSRHDADMIVMAIEGRHGSGRSVRPAWAGRMARMSGRCALFVPHGCRPFVSAATGQVWLRRILLPIDGQTDPRPALIHALRSASLLDDPEIEITLLHLGGGDETTLADLPRLPFCTWSEVHRSGPRASDILAVAEEIRADLIYMPTAWGWPDATDPDHGVVEAVLEGAPCPVLTVPVDTGLS